MTSARVPNFRVRDVLTEIGLPRTWVDLDFGRVLSDFDAEEREFEVHFAQELRGGFQGATHRSGLSEDRARSLYDRLRDDRSRFAIDYYSKVLRAVEDGFCPYCHITPARTVDHFLPKELYPWLSIVPLNLVPACGTCNNLWRVYDEDDWNLKKIHPYLDFPEGRWLGVRLLESSFTPLSFEFYCNPPTEWDDGSRQQILNMFEVLQLKEIYASLSGAISVPLYSGLRRVRDSEGRRLLLEARSADYSELGPNNLTAVVCDQLLAERWFEKAFPPLDG